MSNWFEEIQQLAIQPNCLPTLEELGIIALTGEITDDVYNQIVNKIIVLNGAMIEDPRLYMTMIINSQGGNIASAFGIINFMSWSPIPIRTFVVGMCASSALMISMTGQKGYRYCTPQTELLSHHYTGGNIGSYPQLVAARKSDENAYRIMIRHYSQYTNLKTEEEIRKYLLKDTDTFLTPEEALEYGIVDQIISERENVPGVIFPGFNDKSKKKKSKKEKK